MAEGPAEVRDESFGPEYTPSSGDAAGHSSGKAGSYPDNLETDQLGTESDDPIIYESGCFKLGRDSERFRGTRRGMMRSMTREVRPGSSCGGGNDKERADIR